MVVSQGSPSTSKDSDPRVGSGELRSGWFDERLILFVFQLMCSIILVVDVGGEIHETLLDSGPPKPFMLFHLWIEGFATLLMGTSFVLSYRLLRNHRRELALAKTRINALRGDFSELVDARFRDWKLSPAEFEVALLTVKGLLIAEIARLRDSRESTIKSHLSAIFRKAGVTSRTELLAKFVDDFLTRSAEH
ncbi:MAG: helix-turn-helix transcriptional regulator [Rhodobacteraceae bacterium]|nr:helix-turn-helix transcriptional regulator [Paracoccaceae bacterium]